MTEFTVVENQIIQKITAELSPQYLDVLNESHNHSVPENSETHFKLIIVSADFEGKSRIDRQRMVNTILKQELEGPVHALSQRCYSPKEWESVDKTTLPASPNCRGGTGL